MPETYPADKKPGSSAPWLEMLKKCAQLSYHNHCDKIDKRYADLEDLAKGNADREMQVFWASMQVALPATYSREPIPVVTPRFRERKPVPRRAAEIVERALVTSNEMDDLHGTLKHVRDDLVLRARGVAWLRLDEAAQDVHIEHVFRQDFRHGKARNWREVPWVARRAWLTRDEGKERFGDIFLRVPLKDERKDQDADAVGYDSKGEVWEVWHKPSGKVVWVSEGVDRTLDERAPPFSVHGFFPCPKPAYGTCEPDTLMPVPDYAQVRDQLDEIHELTARIGALTDSLIVRGFIPAGASDVGSAIEHALADTDRRTVLVPVPNFEKLTQGAMGEAIVWMPFDRVATVISDCVNLRRQHIDDVFQISGISDIMRGASDPSETLGAQELKSQYGSIRIRDRQEEMIRMGRDVMRLKGEIMAEHLPLQKLLDLSQVDDIPAQADLEARRAEWQQMAMQAQEAGEEPPSEPEDEASTEQIEQLLRDQRMRPFIIEIETDSTIQADENAEKQRRGEFLQAIGGFIQQAAPLMQADPASADLLVEMLKFVAQGYRAGRSVDSALDEYAESLREKAKMARQQPQEDPGQQMAMQEAQMRLQEMQMKGQSEMAKAQAAAQKAQADLEAIQRKAASDQASNALELEKLKAEIEKLAAETAKIVAETHMRGEEHGQRLRDNEASAGAVPERRPDAHP